MRPTLNTEIYRKVDDYGGKKKIGSLLFSIVHVIAQPFHLGLQVRIKYSGHLLWSAQRDL
jgi:hypothetical protein